MFLMGMDFRLLILYPEDNSAEQDKLPFDCWSLGYSSSLVGKVSNLVVT